MGEGPRVGPQGRSRGARRGPGRSAADTAGRAGRRQVGPGGGAGGRTSGGSCGWDWSLRGPAGTCGRKGTGRRGEARPAPGLGDLSRRRPLALDPASAGREGDRLPPTLAGLGPRTCAGHAVAAGISSCDDRGLSLPDPQAVSGVSGPRPEKLASGTCPPVPAPYRAEPEAESRLRPLGPRQ